MILRSRWQTRALTWPSASNGETASLNGLNSKQYLDVTFLPSDGATLDATTIMDTGAEFTLSGAGVGTAVIDDSTVTAVTGQNGVYRYAFTGSFVEGNVQVNFIAGSWADKNSSNVVKTNLAEIETFTTKKPTAELVDPTSGNSISLADINSDKAILVHFIVADDTTLDTTTITGDEITLSGTNVSGSP